MPREFYCIRIPLDLLENAVLVAPTDSLSEVVEGEVMCDVRCAIACLSEDCMLLSVTLRVVCGLRQEI